MREVLHCFLVYWSGFTSEFGARAGDRGPYEDIGEGLRGAVAGTEAMGVSLVFAMLRFRVNRIRCVCACVGSVVWILEACLTMVMRSPMCLCPTLAMACPFFRGSNVLVWR